MPGPEGSFHQAIAEAKPQPQHSGLLEGALGLPREVIMVASLRALLDKYDGNKLTESDYRKSNIQGRILRGNELDSILNGNSCPEAPGGWQRSLTVQSDGTWGNPHITLSLRQTMPHEGIPAAGITIEIEKNPEYAPGETVVEVTERRSGGEELNVRYSTRGFGYDIVFTTKTSQKDGTPLVHERGFSKKLRGIKNHKPLTY